LYLDCGTVIASLSVDIERAKRKIDKWPTDALKRHIGKSDEEV
jgi:hypothetical protein